VVRHGSMRAQVVGVEAVLADGTVLSRLTPPPKDNTGYDLTQLLCGSEGTLAVITKARLRLVAPPTRSSVALVGLASTSAALGLLAVVKARLTVTAVEIFYAEGLSLVRTVRGLIAPFAEQFPTYVVLECTDGVDELVETLAAAEVGDATVASDAVGKARLWAYRESHTEAISTVGVPVKLDICVPLAELPSLVDTLPGAVPARTIVFGHLNEGNLHVNILGADDPEEVTDTVLKLVAAHHGSISSEHGVGRAKTRWLQLTRTPEEISTMRLIKRALDPDGILNPGVLLPDLGR